MAAKKSEIRTILMAIGHSVDWSYGKFIHSKYSKDQLDEIGLQVVKIIQAMRTLEDLIDVDK